MNSYQLVYPMFVMVALSFVVLSKLFLIRLKSIKEGEVDAKFYKAYQVAVEPNKLVQLSRQFVNLFEARVLFYAACIAAMVIGISETLFLVMAWVYVLMRLVHTFIHTGNNKTWFRVCSYFVSWVVLLAMWVLLMIRVSELD